MRTEAAVGNPRENEDHDAGVAIRERQDTGVQRPRMYRVVLLNDDFTPIDFVVGLVRVVFRKDEAEASRITFEVHERGASVCGVYTHEIAETKCAMVHQHAAAAGHPLMATMEPET